MANANIFAQYLKAPKSVQEYQAEFAEADSRRQVMEKNALEMQAVRDQTQRSNALRNLVTTLPTDPEGRIKALRAANTPEAWAAADAMEKAQAESAKTTAETKYKQSQAGDLDFKTRVAKNDQAIKDIAALGSPEEAIQSLRRQAELGYIDPQKAQMVEQSILAAGPEKFRDWQVTMIRNIMSPKDQMSYITPDANAALGADTSRANNRDTNATSRANNSATNSVAMRGQNMTDARARESTAATMSKPFEVTGPEGTPILVQQDKRGNIVPVQGYSAKPGKAPTEFQGKSAVFGARAEEADKIATELEAAGKYNKAAAVAAGGSGVTNTALNPMLSKDTQKFIQAQRDFINAVLRQESGAAIGKDEFDNARRQYFAQPGDDPEVIKQKENNRKLAIQGFKNSAGPAAFKAPGDQPPAKPSGGLTTEEAKELEQLRTKFGKGG